MAVARAERLAPAKVNLYLGIHEGRDARGYHAADSLMAAVSLFNYVRVEEAEAFGLTCDPPLELEPQKTVCYRAARTLAAAVGREPNVLISIERAIPDGSGFGGASSDAAAVLLCLCELWGIDPRDSRVAQAARATGADVAFFLDPRPTMLAGRGDEPVEVFDAAPAMPVALVRPCGPGVSTPQAYAAFDADPQSLPSSEALCAALRAGDAAAVAANLANNLAPAARALNPQAAEAEGWLRAQPGVLGAQITGSGAASFAICESAEAAVAIANAAKTQFWWSAAAQLGTFC